ncbi:LURP-one-related family protein [Faecalicatena contorta]|uniref:LURP-one-related/scramblase family protein n=1 Tax=Clostridia TaxID=186801 RepID=UPI002E8E3E3A|nr:LURP-one-related family protein [Faecalicatena contorta]
MIDESVINLTFGRRAEMRLLIKQRVFSWTDSYDVYDEGGAAKYFVKAEFFTLGHLIHVYDWRQREVGAIRQKLMTLMPQFEIEMNGVVLGEIQKKFTFFRPRYEVDFKGWHVEGDFLGWEYDVCDGRGSVVHITKEFMHWGDTYVLDFANPADELTGLLLVIAIDAANCTNGQ